MNNLLSLIKSFLLLTALVSVSFNNANAITVEQYISMINSAHAKAEYGQEFELTRNFYNEYPSLLTSFMMAEAYNFGVGVEPNGELSYKYYKEVSEYQLPEDLDITTKNMVAYSCRLIATVNYISHLNSGDSIIRQSDVEPFLKAINLNQDASSYAALGAWIIGQGIEGYSIDDGITFLEEAAKKNSLLALYHLSRIYDNDLDKKLDYLYRAVNVPILYRADLLSNPTQSNVNDVFVYPNFFDSPGMTLYHDYAHYDLSNTLGKLGQYKEALLWLDKMIQKENDPYYWGLRGTINKELEDYEAARDDFEKWAKLEPQNIQAVFSAGNLCLITGNLNKMDAYWKLAASRGYDFASQFEYCASKGKETNEATYYYFAAVYAYYANKIEQSKRYISYAGDIEKAIEFKNTFLK